MRLQNKASSGVHMFRANVGTAFRPNRSRQVLGPPRALFIASNFLRNHKMRIDVPLSTSPQHMSEEVRHCRCRLTFHRLIPDFTRGHAQADSGKLNLYMVRSS
jgi:hypothetical protein